MRQIILEQVQVAEKEYQYVVKRLVNATAPKVGSSLKEAYVLDLCDDADWKVDIK